MYLHILQNDQLQCEEPLLNVTGTLNGILHSLCEVMEIQGLLAKVDNASDLNAVLEQNIIDSCQWVGSHTDNSYIYSISIWISLSIFPPLYILTDSLLTCTISTAKLFSETEYFRHRSLS